MKKECKEISDKIYKFKEMKMKDLEKAIEYMDDKGYEVDDLKKAPTLCGCYNCMSKRLDENGIPLTMSTFIVCPICGNKRCPKATDHSLECSGSNKPGQEGSRYVGE